MLIGQVRAVGFLSALLGNTSKRRRAREAPTHCHACTRSLSPCTHSLTLTCTHSLSPVYSPVQHTTGPRHHVCTEPTASDLESLASSLQPFDRVLIHSRTTEQDPLLAFAKAQRVRSVAVELRALADAHSSPAAAAAAAAAAAVSKLGAKLVATNCRSNAPASPILVALLTRLESARP